MYAWCQIKPNTLLQRAISRRVAFVLPLQSIGRPRDYSRSQGSVDWGISIDVMRYRRSVFPVVVAALIGALALVPADSGPSLNRPPFSRGAKWTYRDRRPGPSGEIRTGTISITYGGETAYRGRRYAFMDASYSLRPGTGERLYLEWAGTHFRQVANVVTNAQHDVLEVVFDQPFRIRVQENASGKAQIFENRALKTSLPWSYTSTAQGTMRVTVPAGTFQARRWDAILRLADREMRYRFFTVGHTDVRWETMAFASGGQTGMTSVELLSGPVK